MSESTTAAKSASNAEPSQEELKEKYSYDNLEPYVHPPETKEELPWAELVTLDLSELGKPGGEEHLAKQLDYAAHNVGFFYVKNFGLSQEEVDHQFTLAKHLFKLPVSEKEKYENDYAIADYNGWRRNGRAPQGTIKDNFEVYNFPKFTKDFEGKYDQPDLIKAHLPEVEYFAKTLHSNVILPLLRLFGDILELDDKDYLVKQHSYEPRSEDHFRYMQYHPRTAEEHRASGYAASGGHTDLGTLTLLFRQPVAGLQIRADDGTWTYVKPQPGTITVNLADTLSHLTGGYLKSSIHRVVSPPEDQWPYERTGLLYFARPHSDIVLNPIDSPKLRRAGIEHDRFNKPVTVREWVKAKQTLQLNPEITKKLYAESSNGRSVEVIAGFQDHKYA